MLLSVGDDQLDLHRRWQIVERQVCRIDDANSARIQEPDFSVL
jgi:hypothetical protein